MNPRPITVLVADGQLLFSDALAIALTEPGKIEVFDERPQSVAAAIEVACARRPDVIVLDYWLGGGSPGDATHGIIAEWRDAKIINLSWVHGPAQAEDALAAGAVGFLPKGIGLPRLKEAILRAYSGESPIFGPQLMEMVSRISRNEESSKAEARRLADLTAREVEILGLVGAGLPVMDVAQLLDISVSTVRTHMQRILSKTQANTQLEAVALAREHGIIR